MDNPTGPLPALTASQRKLLDFMVSYVEENGYPPTVRECMKAGGWSSPSAVAYQLKALVTKGRITRGPGPRMISIVDGNDTEDQHG